MRAGGLLWGKLQTFSFVCVPLPLRFSTPVQRRAGIRCVCRGRLAISLACVRLHAAALQQPNPAACGYVRRGRLRLARSLRLPGYSGNSGINS
eukprot:scaffold240392_cov33-Tisochrysis_lutea.AAC.2